MNSNPECLCRCSAAKESKPACTTSCAARVSGTIRKLNGSASGCSKKADPPDWKQKSEPDSSTQTTLDETTALSIAPSPARGGYKRQRRVTCPATSQSRPVARTLERRGGAIYRLLGVMAADHDRSDGA